MRWIDKLLGRSEPPGVEQAVLIDIPMPEDPTEFAARRDAIFALEDRIARRIEAAGLGELDGDEFGEGTCRLYLYGRDALAILGAIAADLRSTLGGGVRVVTRPGPPGTPEELHEI